MKLRAGFFGEDKIDIPLARLNKRKRRLNKIRNEKEVTTDTTEIQTI